MNLCRKDYITPEAAKTLPSYKYSGSDLSLLYKHFYGKIAQYLVDNVIPTTWAPNSITLAGFACTLIPHLLILSACPHTLEGDVPRWMCLLAAVGLVTYSILDNCDGKQARKTGSSSPLGLLFDHGCDALNTFVSGLTLFTVIQLGNSFWSVWGFIVAFFTFFMATWEEYYIEALNLPCFNGANEGVMGVTMMLLISAMFGTSIWNQQILGLEMKYHVLFFFTVVAAITIAGNLKTVKEKTREKYNDALSNLNVLLYLVATLFIVYLFSPTDMISTSARYLIYFVGFSFGKLVGILQASHCAHQDFQQYRKSILVSASLLNVVTFAGFLRGYPLINESTLIFWLAVFAFAAHFHFVFNIIHQFTEALGISVFKIGKINPPAASQVKELKKFQDEEEGANTDA